MYKSLSDNEDHHKTPMQPPLKGVLQYSILNKGTKSFSFNGRTVELGDSYVKDYTGTYTDLDLSKLIFTGTTDEENHAHVLFDVLTDIPQLLSAKKDCQ